MEEKGINAALLFLGYLSVSSVYAGKFAFTYVFTAIYVIGYLLIFHSTGVFSKGSRRVIEGCGQYALNLCAAFLNQYHQRLYGLKQATTV